MATKQELETQVAGLQAELAALRTADPDRTVLLDANTKLVNENQELENLVDLRGKEGEKLALQLITSAGEAQALQDDLLERQRELAAVKSRVSQLESQLLAKPQALADTITTDQIIFEGTVKALVEHFRRQFCFEDDRAVIVKR